MPTPTGGRATGRLSQGGDIRASDAVMRLHTPGARLAANTAAPSNWPTPSERKSLSHEKIGDLGYNESVQVTGAVPPIDGTRTPS